MRLIILLQQFEYYVFESKGFLILQLYKRSQTILPFSVITIFKINHDHILFHMY